MSHRGTVRELTSVLSPENDARPTLLLGAGASYSSGIPLAAESVKRIARQVYAERVAEPGITPEMVKTSEWLDWLKRHEWFIEGEESLAENFPLVVKNLLQPRAYRQRVLLELINPLEDLGSGYRHLAELVFRGLIGTVLTTNFDECLPQALNEKRPHIRYIAEVNRGPNDFREFDLFNRAQIVWLHGKAEQYTDKALAEETASLDPHLVSQIGPLLHSTPLIVVGYRGAEPSIMEGLLDASRDLAFKKGVFWCHRAGEKLHPNVHKLQDRLKGNFRLLEISGFDELLADLDSSLDRQQRTLGSPASRSDQGYDDRVAPNSSLADLDHDLALIVAKQYSEKLGLPEVTASTLRSFLVELGLLRIKSGTEVPTVAAILLFGKDPQKFFPHSVVTLTIDGKKRQVISGNLIHQRDKLIEWVEQKDVNGRLKVKGRGHHEERRAYDIQALIELVTNLLVHREYADERPSRIEVETNNRIVFSNAGRPPEIILDELKIADDGHFAPVQELSLPRNRSICDVFYGLSKMERAGTGLSDVVKCSREIDGDAVFLVPPGNEGFRAELYQPQSSGDGVAVARRSRPIGTYVLNVLPFACLPSSVTRVKVAGRLPEIAKLVPLDEAGTLLVRGDELWSFASPALIDSIFRPVMTEREVRATPRQEVEEDEDLCRVLSWLLRKHFEQYLTKIMPGGFILEPNKRTNRRAYFVGEDGSPRLLLYDTPRRKAISHEVVKQRGDEPKAWFENEGIAYEIVRLGGKWGIRIKPFYMFTGRDAKTPLPSYLRTSRATRRIKYDRNDSVRADLTFWGRFLSNGLQVISLGHEHVTDLLLEGSFLTIEIPEEGLLDDDDSDSNKMSA